MKKILLSLLLVISTGIFAHGNAVCIEIFDDEDGNGILNGTEQGIEAVDFTVINAQASFPYPVPYTFETDAAGSYCFTGLADGMYTFQVEVPQGWEVSNSGSPYITVSVPVTNGESTLRMGLSKTLGSYNLRRMYFCFILILHQMYLMLKYKIWQKQW